MTETRLFSADPAAGITRWWHYDEALDQQTIETVQDVTELVSGNKCEYASIDERARWKDGLGERVASIPMSIYFDLKRRGIEDDQKALRAWLNDSDNRFFRCRPGRI